MERVKALWQRPFFRVGLALVLVLILGGAAGGLYFTQTVPEQPIDFPHNVHVGLGAQCLYCHPAAAWGPTAGLPSTELCWSCHQQIEKESPELDKLAAFVSENEPVPWVPVFIQPDFVHFTHDRHVASGISCETCHGDIGSQRTAEPIARQNMGWCLDCHQKMRPDDFQHLSDCSLCHY